MAVAKDYSAAILGICCIVTLWAAVAFSLSIQKQQAVHEARAQTANMARAFEESTIRSIKVIEQALFYVRDAYLQNPSGFDLPLWSRNSQSLTDLTFQVAIIGKDGYMVASNLATPSGIPAASVYLGDREHFTVHKGRATDELFISKPIYGRVSGKWTIQFTRAIRAPDGSFQGVAVISLDPEYLSRFFRSVDLGKQGVVMLAGLDGVVRARATAWSIEIGQSLSAGTVMGLQAQATVLSRCSKMNKIPRARVLISQTVRIFPAKA